MIRKEYHQFITTCWHILIMAAILCATILITELLRYHFNFAQHNLVLLYVMSVLLISCVLPGYGYGFIAAITGTFACDFLIVSPRLEFSFSAGSPITLITLLLVTLVTSTMASRLRQQKKLALIQQKHFEILYDINRKLLSARSIPAIVKLICVSLAAHMERPVIFYTGDPKIQPNEGFWIQPDNTGRKDFFLNDSEYQKVHLLFHSYETDRSKLIQSAREPVYYQPVLTNESIAGVIGIYCGSRSIGSDEAAYVNTISGQAALAFEVQYLSDRQEKLLVEAEKEKTRSVLLRSISHDFRTPVATIRGAGSAMRDHPEMPAATREKLLIDIEEYADWLTRTMDNILTITKLSDASVQICRDMEAAEEVISAAVAIIRKRYPERLIQVQIPDRLLLIPMDAALIAQVFINLLENAINHSPADSKIIIRLTSEEQTAVFQVIDQGSGIPSYLGDELFCAYRLPKNHSGDAFRGSGFGLSICKTIIHAHHGEIEGHNAGGGAVFSFTLPMEDSPDAI